MEIGSTLSVSIGISWDTSSISLSVSVEAPSFRMNSVFSWVSYISCPIGRVTINSLPTSGWLFTSILPQCNSINSFTSDKPMPEEGCNILYFTKVSKRWKSVCCFLGSIPIPSSATDTISLSPSTLAWTVIDLLAGVYLKALDNRLKIIFSNLSWSIQADIISWFVCNW